MIRASPDARTGARAVARVRARLIPFLFALYVVSYLDRVNVGFAALHMNADLGLGPEIFGLGAGIFFLGYFLFEVPSNLLMLRFGARLWIGRIMISWGLVSCAMALTGGVTSFLVLRFLLGLAEAGFFPGMILYLSQWFPAAERARAVALFMTATALAGVVGGPISGALLRMHGLGGVAGWQWLFVLEGLPAVVLGIVVLARLPDGPHEARWLDADERAWLLAHLAAEREAQSAAGGHAVRDAFTARAVWRLAAVYFGIVFGFYGISFWLPQIVQAFGGLDELEIGLVSAVPYVAAALAMVWVGRSSDRSGERRWHVAGPALVGALGLAASALVDDRVAALGALSLAAAGIWGALGPFWTLPTAVLSGPGAAAAIALVNSVGNLGGFVGPSVVGFLHGATGGFGAAMGVMAAVLLAAAVLVPAALPPVSPPTAAPRSR